MTCARRCSRCAATSTRSQRASATPANGSSGHGRRPSRSIGSSPACSTTRGRISTSDPRCRRQTSRTPSRTRPPHSSSQPTSVESSSSVTAHTGHEVRIDRDGFERALANVIDNALRHTPARRHSRDHLRRRHRPRFRPRRRRRPRHPARPPPQRIRADGPRRQRRQRKRRRRRPRAHHRSPPAPKPRRHDRRGKRTPTRRGPHAPASADGRWVGAGVTPSPPRRERRPVMSPGPGPGPGPAPAPAPAPVARSEALPQ